MIKIDINCIYHHTIITTSVLTIMLTVSVKIEDGKNDDDVKSDDNKQEQTAITFIRLVT